MLDSTRKQNKKDLVQHIAKAIRNEVDYGHQVESLASMIAHLATRAGDKKLAGLFRRVAAQVPLKMEDYPVGSVGWLMAQADAAEKGTFHLNRHIPHVMS